MVNELFKYQRKLTGIHRDVFKSMSQDYKKGYIKVCSHWLARFWTGDNNPLKQMSKENQNPTILNAPTKIFDSCGVNDWKNEVGVPRGSRKSEWSDALKFLEWYGLPQMEGFGVIIIDNMGDNWQDQYVNLRTTLFGKGWIKSDEEFQERILGCFDGSK